MIFREKITDFDEYKQLQHFYKDRVIKESFQKFAKTTDLFRRVVGEKEKAQAAREEVVEVDGAHLIGNLEAIKEDHHYELFFLKNEAGHHFFTYDLIRDMKLACDFGAFSQEYFGDDPLLQIKNWQDRSVHLLAERMLATSKRWLDGFYKEALRFLQVPMVANLHRAIMALMLAANPRNLIRQFSPKGCYRYFDDFQQFLREVLLDRDFQKFLLYAPPASQPFFLELIRVVESLSFNLFTLGADQKEWESVLKTLAIRNGAMKTEKISDFFHKVDHELTNVLKKHPNGPLFKTFDLMLQEDGEHAFDPLIQGNIPTVDGSLNRKSKATQLIRMPSPTTQEYVQKAFVIEEFLTYLRACSDLKEGRRHLIVNFQDRTSWSEHARCAALEDLSRQAEFVDVLSVVTLAKDTDFYNQTGPYQSLDASSSFIEQMHLQLKDESTGFYFAPAIKEKLFNEFIDPLLHQVHETLFDKKKD